MIEEDKKFFELMDSSIVMLGQKFTFDTGVVKLEDQIKIETGVFERSHWKLKDKDQEIEILKAQLERLKHENEVLRSYMNRDVESMADAALAGLT